jgi:hypothetical protein
MLAVKLPFDQFEFEDVEDYLDNSYKDAIESKNGLTVISDGMNGKYMFIGEVIDKSRYGLEITNCTDVPEQEFAVLQALIFSEFGIEEADVKVWAFSHFT